MRINSSLIYHLDLLQYNVVINSLPWRWSTFWGGCVVNGLVVGGHFSVQDSMSLAYMSLAESYKSTVIFFPACLSTCIVYSSTNKLIQWLEEKISNSLVKLTKNQSKLFSDDRNFLLLSWFLSIYYILDIFLYILFCNRRNLGPKLLKWLFL